MSARDVYDALVLALVHQRRQALRNLALSLVVAGVCLLGRWLLGW